jgi:hypothetical protein
MRVTHIAVLFLVLGLVSPAAGLASAPFCDAPTTNPYLAPLGGLPALHEPPHSGPLPFAPSVYMKPVSSSLVVSGEDIGFTFPVREPGGRGVSQKPWLKVEVTVLALAPNGRVRQIVQQSAKFVQSTRPARVTFSTPMSGGLYRVDAVFEKRDGVRVGKYSKYFRSAPPRFGARLGLSNRQIAPGESVFARVENIGVVRFGVGYGYRVERFSGMSWEVDPSLQGKRSVPKVLVFLGPSATFDCLQVPVPPNQAPGLYRFTKEVSRSGSAGARHVAVINTFTVVPQAP